jgi:spermidine/putrescine transport system substrate-binding protein
MQDKDRPVSVGMTPKVARRQQQRLLTRRTFLGAGAAAISLPIVATACSTSSSTTAGGTGSEKGTTVRIITYIDWFGKTEISDFEHKTGITVDQIVVDSGPDRISKIAEDNTAADMTLADLAESGQFKALGILAKVNWANIPNYKLVPAHYKQTEYSETAAHGIVSDFGRTSFAYRTDKVSENLTSWKDVWNVAEKYSGKITFINGWEDSTSSALAYLGYSLNSVVPSQVNAAGDALIKIKPHLQSLTEANAMNGLLNGSVYIAMDWDYDAAAALHAHPTAPIKWVNASDGMFAYLEGWLAFNTSKVLPEVERFMNNHISPPVYGEFVNTQGISNMIPAAVPHLEPWITKSPVLNPSPEVIKLITFGENHGEGQKLWDQMWARFLAA